MGRNEKNELLKHRKTAITPKLYPDISLCPTTSVANKTPPPTRPKKQATRRKCLRDCSNQLGLKFLVSSPPCRRDQPADSKPVFSQSIIKRFMELKHVFNPDMSRTLLPSEDELPDATARGFHRSPMQCHLLQNPSIYFNQHIQRYTAKFVHNWRSDGCLRIPSSWSVFQNMDWNEDGSFQWRSTDPLGERTDTVSDVSSDDSRSNSSRASSTGRSDGGSPSSSTYTSSNSSHAPSEVESMGRKYLELGGARGVVRRGNEVTQPRARGQWSFLATITSCPFGWTPDVTDGSLNGDNVSYAGQVDFNQQAQNHDIWPQMSFSALLSHWTTTEDCVSMSTVGEVPLSQMLGRLLASGVETEMFPAYFERKMRWPSLLRESRKLPVITYTCRAAPRYLGWREDMCPLLFAAQFSPYKIYQRPGLESAIWKLEQAFRPTMALLILYYLDTRIRCSDPLPSWMVLFGMIYTENGVHIRGHSPYRLPQTADVQTATEVSGWTTTSWDVNAIGSDSLLYSPQDRAALLFALNHLQGHCKLVLEHLKAWEGYGRACQLFRI